MNNRAKDFGRTSRRRMFPMKWTAVPGLLLFGTLMSFGIDIPEIDETALARHIEKLASFGSRIPGYPGHDKATAYLREEFQRLGYTGIKEDVFEVTVPVDEGSSLEVTETGKRYPLHALWPNLVRTSQLPLDGVVATAVDGGQGHWADFNGKTISNNVIFISFNSDTRWLNAAMLGARAVVFVEPATTTRRQAEAKFAEAPLNVPRFWIQKDDYESFARDGFGKNVRVRCRMPWKKAKATNLRILLEGTDPDRTLCIESYYDSMSVVPSLAPGGEMACGIAAMMELARVMKEDPPPCNVLFLATSGHFLYHAGINDFMLRHCRKREPYRSRIAHPIDLDLMVCLDLTSRNDTVGMVANDYEGNSRSGRNLYAQGFLRHATIFRSLAEEMSDSLGRQPEDIYLNLVLPQKGGSWQTYIPELISLDCKRALDCATPAVNLVTIQDPRSPFDSPLDTADEVQVPSLTRQVRFLAGALQAGARDDRFLQIPKMGEDELRIFHGRIVTFDPTKSFVPDQPVPGGLGILSAGRLNTKSHSSSRLAVRTTRLSLAEDDGRFTSLSAVGDFHYTTGFGLDPDTGDIVMALDEGLEGIQQFPVDFKFDAAEKERSAVLFKCRATDLYDIVDPRYLISMDKLLLYDAGNVEPFAYGYSIPIPDSFLRSSDSSPYATVFTKPGVRMKIGVSADVLGQRMLLLNAPSAKTQADSEGFGYPLGEERLIVNVPYQALRDMHHLDAYRMSVIKSYGIDNARLERLHAAAGEALESATTAAEGKQWDRFITYARRGLGIESRAYPDVTATADDVIKGIIFYMALMIPFAFFCERLFFSYSRLSHRIMAFTAIFFATYLVLRLVHPAFQIVQNSEVILLGLVVLVLSGFVVFISSSQFEAQMRTYKRQIGRIHETDVSRVSATGTAFSLGVSNMRRRKVRAMLTCTAIVLLMFTVLSFTSVKSYLRPRQLPQTNVPAYEGALIRDRVWRPMPFLALDHIQSEFAETAVIARRGWLAPRRITDKFTRIQIMIRPVREAITPTQRVRAFGLVGMDPEETKVSNLDRLLTAGRWFEEGEKEVCILPDTMAETLGIDPGDVGSAKVHLLGMHATVIGIVSAKGFNEFRDLDDERPTPQNFSMLGHRALSKTSNASSDVSNLEGRAPLQTFVHLDAENIALVPYETLLDLGGALQSVALVFHDGNVGEHVTRFLDRLAVTVFVGENNKVKVYSSLAANSVGGMGNIVVPVLIAALMVLNTMSGSVHERLKEIGTYSAVGLAPSHIGALFIAEACVYAILGGIAGYVLGQVIVKVLALTGGLAGLTLNYSSLASVFATIVVMATVLLSTLYPARMASRLAVPDVTRRWKLPDPDGDLWNFDFPFTVSGKEVKGLYVFFKYYFASYEEQSVGRFYTTSTELSEFEENGSAGYRLKMRVWLSPYDLGVSQDVDMMAVPTGDFGVFQIRLRITRLSGQANTWVKINRGFLNEIRKQFLLWRTVAPESKQEYTEEAEKAFG